MTFDLLAIGLCIGLALAYALFAPPAWRGWVLLTLSAVAVYVLQPFSPVRFVDFALPTAAIALAVTGWWLTRAPGQTQQREDVIALLLVVVIILLMAANRFLDAAQRLTPSRPPEPLAVAGLLAGFAVLVLVLTRPLRTWRGLFVAILALVALFAVLKAEPLGAVVSGVWRTTTGQDIALAALSDLNWLGFSYLAFRLIHTLRDRQTGLLPVLSLREYLTYALFFPAYIAGPIDRAARFAQDLRALPGVAGLDAARSADGLRRIAVGVFKKFIIADTLAQGMALDTVNAAQAVSTAGLWLLLYGYALRLFFDFSGYTDIAIGIGLLFGLRLPENFDRPYLRTSITAFWQSWHKTLSDWVRFYVFTPLSRALLRRKPHPSPMLVMLAAQLATMTTIGLWHGINANFLVWGVWHGFGLFAHSQWSERTRRWQRGLTARPIQRRLWAACAWFITFHFVVLGWVWFALPDFGLALAVFGKLFGVGL